MALEHKSTIMAWAWDINGDSRLDILCAHGWWEAPVSDSESSWAWHEANFGGKAAQMYVYDFDDDGDADVTDNDGTWHRAHDDWDWGPLMDEVASCDDDPEP